MSTPLTQFVKPAEGRRVRKENGELLAAAGEDVPVNVFWRRRLREGDVVPATAPKTPSKDK